MNKLMKASRISATNELLGKMNLHIYIDESEAIMELLLKGDQEFVLNWFQVAFISNTHPQKEKS